MGAAEQSTVFWPSLWALRDAVSERVVPRMLLFTLPALACLYLHPLYPKLALEVGPVEIAGGALGLLMVLRTNAGYERWWEGRKLWGSITNATRNLVVAGLSYGPARPDWRRELVGWVAAFAHVSRRSLRGERELPELVALVGEAGAAAAAAAEHMPTYVSQRIAALLQQAFAAGELPAPALLSMERLRGELIDQLGGCERIERTPLPKVYVIKLRRFTSIYLTMLPLALVDKVGWATPLLVMLVAYPVLGMDEIAHQLQRPFLTTSLSHLPLDTICTTIEGNLRAVLGASSGAPAATEGATAPAPAPTRPASPAS